jgi:hypothetical protein
MSSEPESLPTVELVEGDFYWIRDAYETPAPWQIAKWVHSAFWDVNGREVTARTICGPIPRPAAGEGDR